MSQPALNLFSVWGACCLDADVLMTVGLLSIVGVRIDLTVAAVLTIIGYLFDGDCGL